MRITHILILLAAICLPACRSSIGTTITISHLRGSDDAPTFFRYRIVGTELCVEDIKERIGCVEIDKRDTGLLRAALQEIGDQGLELKPNGFLDSDEIWIESEGISIGCNLGSCPESIERALSVLGKKIAKQLDMETALAGY